MKPCDLVLEGGLVSGLIHPAAVIQLSRTYSFRKVGGASAGAFVAAATAAAEMARGTGGFDRLAEFSCELARGDLVDQLFQASPEATPLLRTVLAAMQAMSDLPATAPAARAYRTLRALLASTPGDLMRGATLGLIGFVLFAAFVDGRFGWLALFPALLFACAGALVAALTRIGVIARDLRRTGFGLVSGLSQPGGRGQALTEWLASWLDRIAGVPAPLTLGQLSDAGVPLHTITTNLSEGRPYAVPFSDHRFLFAESDMRELFPPAVVNHMVQHAYDSTKVTPPPGYHFLPEWKDLPVIVAVRLSNSFPLFLRSIPLYSIDTSAAKTTSADQRITPRPGQLCRNWFSDGGICSNFPIHFFDRWIPEHPTFGISIGTAPAKRFYNLTNVDPQLAAESTTQGVHLPSPNRPEPSPWQPIDSVGGFLGAALMSAKDSRDTLQRELPGYRERVVQVLLPAGAAGLGPAMDPTAARDLVDLGTKAGRALQDFDFAQHLWVRLRSLIPRLAYEAERLHEQLQPAGAGVPFTVKRAQDDASKSVSPLRLVYPAPSGDWVDRAQELLLTLATAGASPLSQKDQPRPVAALRVTPQFGDSSPRDDGASSADESSTPSTPALEGSA